jgi:outer membrane lipoprotein-sorting protein
MKKTIFAILSLAVLTMGSAYAQDLQEILDKYFETIGQENLLKVKSQISTGKILQMGMEMPFKAITKRPNKSYLEMEIQGAMMKQAYDGENGWMIAPWTGSADPIDLSGPEARSVKEMADMDGNLWNYEEKGHQLELVGTEEMEGAEVYFLKLTKEGGDVDHYFIDTDNFVVMKMTSKIVINGQETKMEILFSNYRDVKGVLVPFTTEQRFDGQTGMTVNIEEVKINEEIDDAIFLKPVPTEAEEQ